MQSRTRSSRRGFTLVEMLVVIAIIGILVALLIPTIGAVMWRVRNAAITAEMQDLSRAMEAYKSFANDYPPDFSNSRAVIDHMTKAFPRNTRNVQAWLGANPTLDPAEAIVFWLSLLSTNPRDPLGGSLATYAGERKTLFEFKADRLIDKDGDGWKEYVPPYGKDMPYVYFDGRVVGGMYAYTTAVYPQQPANPVQPAPVAGDVVRPYRSITDVDPVRDNNRTRPYKTPTAVNNVKQWMNPGKFQIVCAGQDSEWGPDNVVTNTVVFKTFPEVNYTIKGSDEDNLADFAEMKTLGDSVP